MDYLKKAINYSSGLINKNIYLYLYNLIKYIFLNTEKSVEFERKLVELTDKINEEIIKDKSKFINIKNNAYSKENFMNILDFIKMQNLIYAGDIMEGILIMAFSCAFETERDKSFGQYLFKNLDKIMNPSKNDLANWFKGKEKFRNIEEFGNINDLITYDINEEINIDKQTKIKAISFQNKSVFYNLLLEINKMKYSSFSYNKINSKAGCYIHRGKFDIQEKMNKIYNKINQQKYKNNLDTKDKDILHNSISKIVSFISNDKKRKEGEIIFTPVRLIKAFFTSVYIYYQNKNSLLMELIEPYKSKDDDDDDDFIYKDPIPFEYDLKGAEIYGKYSNIILSPMRLEPRVNRIVISENFLRDCGFYDISKILLFNHNISYIDLNKCYINSIFLDYFNFGLGVFDNYSIEELNISNNYIKEDCGEYLSRMLSHLKGLKTIILSSNELKGGLSFFFVLLKRLYRKHKTNLENLYLNNCALDDASFYELGELLKSKYCKLKKLSMNQNNNPSNINFLKKIKKNRTLLEFDFSQSTIDNHDIEEINRIISNTIIKHLYLFKNRITNWNDFLKILYRTKLIKDKDESDDNVMKDDDSLLINLTLSSNALWIKNKDQAILINKIIKETNLSCLDISHILLGLAPDKFIRNSDNENYINYILADIKKPLEENLKEYRANIRKKASLEYEIKKRKENNNEIINIFDKELEEFKELKKEINKNIEKKEAQFIPFLKEKANEIVEKIKKEQENKEEYENIVKKENLNNKEDNNKFIQKLVDYMKFKELQNRFSELYKKVKEKKLIII